MPRYLVTGASRGIGRAVVDLLAPTDELIVLGRDASALAELPVARRIVLDLAAPARIAEALPAFDRLDGVIHCAGVIDYGPVADGDAQAWQRAFDVNVLAVAELTRLLLPAVRAAAGTMVFLNSGQGLNASPRFTSYAASKHALRALADGVRAEEPGIRVCSIFIGRVATDMQRELRAAEGGEFEPDRYLRPATVAQVVAGVLRLPSDGVITDLTLRPQGLLVGH